MWIFFLSDLALLAAAGFIAAQSSRPLSTQATFAIFACIFGGALIALVPLIARYERQKNEALDERQRELEALGRTVTASAEQISIATGGLNAVTEHAQKILKHAEQLQQKLHERIAEFHAGIVTASDAEKEEMAKELETLRASESERLQAIADRIAKSATDWSRLEAATSQHLGAANEALAKLAMGTASAIGKAQAAAEQALSQARVEAARTFGEASGAATKALEAATASALAEIDARAAGMRDANKARVAEAAKPTSLPAEPRALPAAPNEPPNSTSTTSTAAEETVQAARPKKSKSPDAGPAETSPAATAVAEGSPAIAAPEPSPVLAQRFTEVVPIVPDTVNPFALHETAPTLEARTNGHTAPTPARPIRKRTPKPASTETPAAGDVGAGGDPDASEGLRSGVVERVISSDGATRLVVTAYIGIGNRLFIRGEGPGLSWDKGVPLQFVSIGKWRWETNDATGPVKFKLFKNDDLECAALGSQSLDPGQQQEVTAAF